MSKTKLFRNLLGAGAFVATATAASAQQYAHEPYFEWPVVASQAYGLEMIAVRLNALEAIEPPYARDFIEVVEQMAKADFARFAGTLSERDRDLAADFQEVLAYFEEELEEGRNPASMLPTAREMLADAYDLLIDPALRETPEFKGIVAAQLMLGPIAEGYEEAVEGEVWAYTLGWSGLQRFKELWADLQSAASPQQLDEINQIVTFLDTIYDDPAPMIPWVGGNPEEAEAPAQLATGILEAVMNTAFFSGRDLPRLATHLAAVAGPGCEAYAVHNELLGTEIMMVVGDHYLGERTGMADLVMLFNPDLGG